MYNALMNEKTAIDDRRRIISHHEAEKLGFAYYGIRLARAIPLSSNRTINAGIPR